jgi:uncharacterized protein (TIGR01319 family)
MDVLASNDGRLPHEKIQRIRQLRPDMILLSGGTDGGTITHVAELAEYISAADPKPRFGMGFKLPVIFAGNKDAREEVKRILAEQTSLYITENLRPRLEEENLHPARHKIHDLFLEHVMAQAPGYKKLMSWTSAPIMPTPAAVGLIMETIAKKEGINLLGVDIGGATTDTFSVFDRIFNRTVSANLGLSYSISNVLAEAGIENILRWIPFDIDEKDLRNRIKNKMIRPTTIPQTLQELLIEQAIAREALRLALEQHKLLAVGLKGVQQERTMADAFDQRLSGQTLVDMFKLDLIVGSGGILSHAPRRVQSMMMMIDAYQPLGITHLAVDSIFMMPHLGVLSVVSEKAATDVFVRDCMIYLGTCVSPKGQTREGQKVMDYKITFPGGAQETGSIYFGELRRYPLGVGEEAEAELSPAKGFDLGRGRGRRLSTRLKGGVVGIIIDARGRPFEPPKSPLQRKEKITSWYKAVGMYPEIP